MDKNLQKWGWGKYSNTSRAGTVMAHSRAYPLHQNPLHHPSALILLPTLLMWLFLAFPVVGLVLWPTAHALADVYTTQPTTTIPATILGANSALAQYNASKGHTGASAASQAAPTVQPPTPKALPGPTDEDVRIVTGKNTERDAGVDMTSARQQGIKEYIPELETPVAKDFLAKDWLANWFNVLKRSGVPEKRFVFEANRLSQPDFNQWALNRMEWVRLYDKGSEPNPVVDVGSKNVSAMNK